MRNALQPGRRPLRKFPARKLIETIAETGFTRKKINDSKKFAQIKRNTAKLRFLFLQLIVR